MDQTQLLIDPIADLLGVSGASVLSTLAVLSLLCRVIGKAIPDTQPGWLGVVRKLAKIGGLYTNNRVVPTDKF